MMQHGQPVDGYPALLGGGASPVNELLVMSGLTVLGQKWAGAQTAPWVTVGAPGQDVRVASTQDLPLGQGYRPGRGTSEGRQSFVGPLNRYADLCLFPLEASASGAGLAAYFKSLTSCMGTLQLNNAGSTPRQRVAALKALIENLAWARIPTVPKGTWNGVNPLRPDVQVQNNCGSGWVSVAAENVSSSSSGDVGAEASREPLLAQDNQLEL